MGGLPRRATFITQEKAEGIEMLLLDSGNFAAAKPIKEPALETAADKAELILKAMERMEYSAVAVGEKDLYLGIANLRLLSEMTNIRFLSANLKNGNGKTIFEPYRIFKVGQVTVGVIGITSPPSDTKLFLKRAPGAAVADPLEAAKEAVEEIRSRCHLVVILSNAGYNRDLAIADSIPGVDIIISGGSKRYMKRPLIRGKTLVTSGYYEGRSVGRLLVHLDGPVSGWISRKELEFVDRQLSEAEGKTDTPEGQKKHEALTRRRESLARMTVHEPDMVNLDPSIPDDPQVVEMINNYRKGLKKAAAGKPSSSGVNQEQVHYTGPDACVSCHESRYRFWLQTDHAGAFESLIPRNAEADTDCLPCHVTGYMRRTGYWPKAAREELRGVQCEACHGVGSLHVKNPDLYSLLHLPAAPQCMDCHTQEQDGDFDYFRDKSLVCSEDIQ